MDQMEEQQMCYGKLMCCSTRRMKKIKSFPRNFDQISQR